MLHQNLTLVPRKQPDYLPPNDDDRFVSIRSAYWTWSNSIYYHMIYNIKPTLYCSRIPALLYLQNLLSYCSGTHFHRKWQSNLYGYLKNLHYLRITASTITSQLSVCHSHQSDRGRGREVLNVHTQVARDAIPMEEKAGTNLKARSSEFRDFVLRDWHNKRLGSLSNVVEDHEMNG